VGAVFTYYLKEDIKTKKEIRQERENELIEKGEKISYPTFEQMRQEDDEIDPILIFTIRDQQGNIVRKMEKEPEKGIHRITWDFHYPPTDPAQVTESTFDNPFTEPDRGPLALPGSYTVSLDLLKNEDLTQLVSPVPFSTRFLNHTTLPAPDKEALLEFQEEVAEMQRIVSGTNQALDELQDKMEYINISVNNAKELPVNIGVKVNEIDQRLKDIDRKLNGDYSLRRREFPVPPSISSRINTIINGLWSSTSAPTETQKSSLELVKNEFGNVYMEIKQIKEVEITELEAMLEKGKAPWTPGRLPEWEK
jgi:hypothetical protein